MDLLDGELAGEFVGGRMNSFGLPSDRKGNFLKGVLASILRFGLWFFTSHEGGIISEVGSKNHISS